MITENYPNPNAPKKFVYVPPVHTPHIPYGAMANGMGPFHNEHEAKRKGCTVEEFVRRDVLVRQWRKECINLYVGKKVYPYTKKDYEEKGAHVITQIYSTYGMMESKDWDEAKARYIVGAKSEKDGSYTTATPKYFIETEPTE